MTTKDATTILRTIMTITVLLFLAVIVTQSAESADSLELSASTSSGTAGGQVTVSITVENAGGSEGGQFVLTFDPALVRPVSIETGKLVTEVSNSLYMANLEYASGQLMYMWVTATADTADSGILCEITFELLKAGETRLEFKDVVIAPEGFGAVATDPGRITVRSTGTDTGVAEEENDENNNDRVDETEEEETEVDNEVVEEDEDIPENDNDDEEDEGNGFLLTGLIIFVVAAAAGLLIYNRLRKPGA